MEDDDNCKVSSCTVTLTLPSAFTADSNAQNWQSELLQHRAQKNKKSELSSAVTERGTNLTK
jgi:hypothetical protein